MSITGGQVSFEQSRKLAEYENRKVQIIFNVTDETGAEAEVIRAGDLAKFYVLKFLDLIKETTRDVASSTVAVNDKAREAAAAVDAKPKKPGRPPKAEPAANISTGGERVDPAQVGDPLDIPEALDATKRGEAKLAADAASVGDEDWGAAAPEIDDAALTGALNRRNQAINNPTKIKGLIAKFVTPPKGARDIPQDQRAKFLEDLEALT